MINLFLAATALLVVAWVSIQLVSMLGLTRIYPSSSKSDEAVTDFRIDADLGNWEVWGRFRSCGGDRRRADPVRLAGAAKYDRDARSNTPSTVGKRLVHWSSAGRPVALSVALGWLFLVLGLPAAATGVAEAATQNQPTATVARGLTTLGLVTPRMCSSAFQQDVKETMATLQAASATGVERKATAGACGAELELSSTEKYDSDEKYAAVSEFAGLGRGVRLAGLSALLLAVLGLLRSASTSSDPAESTRFARLRGRLLVWYRCWSRSHRPVPGAALLPADVAERHRDGERRHLDGSRRRRGRVLPERERHDLAQLLPVPARGRVRGLVTAGREAEPLPEEQSTGSRHADPVDGRRGPPRRGHG